MKTMKINIAAAFLTIVFISSCSMFRMPTVGGVAGKAVDKAEDKLTEGTVEVIESSMEKTEGYTFSEDKMGIIISGTAKYIPAKVGAVPFEELDGEFSFNLLDANGNKVRTFNSFHYHAEMGKNGEPENVEPNEPFPFKLEGKSIALEDWKKIEDHEFQEWH